MFGATGLVVLLAVVFAVVVGAGAAMHEGYVGEVVHDRSRKRGLAEDLSLPVPAQVHQLGHVRQRIGQRGLTKMGKGSRRRLEDSDGEDLPPIITPLYQGYGTHFSYVYIGTPPQRQSVIVDTGSHYTAFPCTGCSQCGQHTDNYWDPKNSSSCQVQKCGKDQCSFGQSYSEGSSWRAYKVVDKLWVGGIGQDTVPKGAQYGIDFMFGCQISETGLFRTQLADGIMGMAMAKDTLPTQLVNQHITNNHIFAMCFRVGGGIMTLGGVDQRIHTKPGIQYASIRDGDGWYTITLLDIQLMAQGTREKKSLNVDASKYSSGKGVIVDSGTTDTYLPQAIQAVFAQKFRELSGIEFSSANFKLTDRQLMSIPNVVFVLQGTDGQPFDVVMPWTNYIDKVGDGMYAFRIYLTEGSGAVLGANFMDGYNVIFDKDNKRVGFAKSDCVYEEFQPKDTPAPSPVPTHRPTVENQPDFTPSKTLCISKDIAVSACTAKCNNMLNNPHVEIGTQDKIDSCDTSSDPKKTSASCSLQCVGSKIVRGDSTCPEKAWTTCNHGCTQTRDMPVTEDLVSGKCNYKQQARACYSGDCPLHDGDMLIFIDMRIGIAPTDWSYVYREVFFNALASIFKVNPSAVELLNDASAEYTMATKLHFQLRLKAKNYPNAKTLVAAAQNIPVVVWKESFKAKLINILEEESKKIDHLDYSRYGYLKPFDVEILNAVALPLGEVRDPIDIPNEGGQVIIQHITEALKGREEYFLLGVAIASVLMMCCMFFLYIRLHQENLALAKEKIESSSLMRVYNKFRGWRGGNKVNFDARGKQYDQVGMQMTGHGNNPMHDDDIDDEDLNDARRV